MPRIRTLKPEHRQHRKVGPLTDREYRLWVGMILEADDEGRLVCDAEHLRVVVFGYQSKLTVAHIRSAIATLEATGLVCTYVNGPIEYAYFPSWKDHQRIDHPTASVLPGPSDEDRPYKKIRIPDAVRREVAARYGAVEGVSVRVKCHYCREAEGGIHIFSETGWVAFAELELDHVLPEYRGGQSTAENIVLACRKCNRSKGSRILANDPRTLANVPVGRDRIGRKGSERNTNTVSPRAEDAPPADWSTAEWPSPEALAHLYNTEGPDNLPAVETLSLKRREAARRVLRQFPARAWWNDVFAEYRASRFLSGKTSPRPGHEGFKPDFDWLMQTGKKGAENVVRVHDGVYR